MLYATFRVMFGLTFREMFGAAAPAPHQASGRMAEKEHASAAPDSNKSGAGGPGSKSREDAANTLSDRLDRDLAVQGTDSTPAANEDSTQDGNADRRPDPASPSND